MSTTLRECVERGAEFLDERLGTEWPKDINLEILNLNSSCHCVLGQLPFVSGNFFRVLDALNYGDSGYPWAREHGFLAKWDDSDTMGDDYDALTDEWKAYLGGRLDAQR